MKPDADADALLIAHMRECLDRVLEYTGGDEEKFRASRLIQDAVVRNLQTLTESSQRLSEKIKATEPTIPWRDLSGFRNIVVHRYLGIELAIVWSVVANDLSILRPALDRMATRLDQSLTR